MLNWIKLDRYGERAAISCLVDESVLVKQGVVKAVDG